MSFDLRVTFTGLTMFVPDDDLGPGNGRLHVFLPDMRGHEPHFARVVFDRAHLVKDSKKFSRDLECRELEGKELIFPGQTPEGLELALNEEVPDLDRVWGHRKLKRTLLNPVPVPNVTSRLSFAAGVMTNCKLGARFKWLGAPAERMTWQVEWSVRGLPGTQLDWAIRAFGGNPVQLDPLFPIGRTVHVGIYHVPWDALPPLTLLESLGDFGDPEHMRAYYELADPDRALTLPIPRREDEDVIESGGCRTGSPPEGSPPEDAANIGAGSTNCLTGRATMELP